MVEGPPEVSETFTSNCLKEFTSVRKVVTVKAWAAMGMVIFISLVKGVAPSIFAASCSSMGTFSMAAM